MNRACRIAVTLAALPIVAGTTPARAQVADRIASPGTAPTAVSIDAARVFPVGEATPSRSGPAAPAVLPLPKYGGWVGVTKWLTLATATGLGTLGFLLHNEASDKFDQLEARCSANPDLCREVNPDGSYADPQLEALYQDVVDRDNQARVSLIAAEVSFGLSVLLFIVDFQKDPGPRDIPYRPPEDEKRLQLGVTPGEMVVRYYIN